MNVSTRQLAIVIIDEDGRRDDACMDWGKWKDLLLCCWLEGTRVEAVVDSEIDSRVAMYRCSCHLDAAEDGRKEVLRLVVWWQPE